MKALKNILIVLAVAAAVFAASAPFLVIERWLGFTVLGALAALYFLLHRRLWPQRRLLLPCLGFAGATVLLVPAALFAGLIEGGFDDGPFVGRDFTGDLHTLKPSFSLNYRSGNLVIYNRDPKAPVVAYVTGDKAQWAIEMYAALNPNAAESELYHMEAPAISQGLVRDELHFTAYWSQGAERGYAYIWKFGGIQRFYLSW
ncbi:MAG TPA: hypothetical protein VIY48_06335 [Candidatus Paceibacterota bacterium]